MNTVVHLLFTIRMPHLEPYSQLVFRSLRIGFPTAKINVWSNGYLDEGQKQRLEESVDALGGERRLRGYYGKGGHPSWIRWVLDFQSDQKPFWIVDCDMVFFREVESFRSSSTYAIAGAFIPRFRDEFTGTVTEPRLHTSLMWIDPGELRDQLDDYFDKFHYSQFMGQPDLISPNSWPWLGDLRFQDTMAGVYQAIDGQRFDDDMLDRYFHLHFGTFPDLVLPRLANGDALKSSREAVLSDPELGRGQWRHQQAYFKGRSV